MNRDQVLFEHTTKGLPYGASVTAAQIASKGWNVLRGDMPLPVVVLRESALAHNLCEMALWSAENGLLLAPHGKTTMSPELFARQIEHGAWAITVANIHQAALCARFGINRVIIANQVIDAANLRGLAALVNDYPELEIYTLADSVAGVGILAEGLRRAGASRSVRVLIEWGKSGWRTGVRSLRAGVEVCREALRNSDVLRVAGIEAFEGLASSSEGVDAAAGQVDEFFDDLRAFGRELRAAISSATQNEAPILSIGSSAFLDCVLRLASAAKDDYRIVLRSGSYITHDHGFYERHQAAGITRGASGLRVPELRPALELWAVVQSVPEPGHALLNFGKRDSSYDLGLPLPLFVLPEGGDPSRAQRLPASRIIGLNDQHAHLAPAEGETVRVGDLVCCGLSHPCTVFDKWRAIPVVDDDYNVIDLYQTCF
jgi:D-serine dehydratase